MCSRGVLKQPLNDTKLWLSWSPMDSVFSWKGPKLLEATAYPGSSEQNTRASTPKNKNAVICLCEMGPNGASQFTTFLLKIQIYSVLSIVYVQVGQSSPWIVRSTLAGYLFFFPGV